MTRFRALELVAAAVVSAFPVNAACRADDPTLYNGYRVNQVSVVSLIPYISAASADFDELKRQLPLQPGAPFSLRLMSEGVPLMRETIQANAASSDQRIKIVVATARPENCDDTARTLDVVYIVFTNILRTEWSHTFEQRSAEIERPSAAAAEGGAAGRLLVRPTGGYNRTRRGYGGLDVTSDVPFGPWQRIDVRSAFSGTAKIADADATGAWDPHRAYLSHADGRFGVRYRETPAGSAILKEAKLAAEFFASTQPLADGALTLRYGATLEGGHQQTVDARSAAIPNSSVGALKLYFGATGRSSYRSFSVSYGAELGSTLTDRLLDFDKHLIDVAVTQRILPMPKKDDYPQPSGTVHKPLDLELRATAGFIHQPGRTPAAERFFGGNEVRRFVEGESWVIPDGAFIRSVAENRLGGLASSGALGGTRFYSGNLTASKVVWGRPLVPKDLAADADFVPALKSAISTAKGALADRYKANDPAYAAAYSELNVIVSVVGQLEDAVKALDTSAASVQSAVQSLNLRRSAVSRIAQTVLAGGHNSELSALANFQLTNLQTQMATLAQRLRADGQTTAADRLAALSATVAASQAQIKAALQRVDTTAAQARADKDFAPAEKVLRSFLYELNIYSIAPVAILDVARVWPAAGGIHWALGGGVRLSLVNLNLTVGYAASPTRAPGEGRGAFFIKLDVMDMFR
jgi:hypothetical protein